MSAIVYYSVNITVKFEGMHALQALLFPVKTIGYVPGFGGVTLTRLIEKDMESRLKQCKIDMINLVPTPKRDLETKFMADESTFAVYDLEPRLRNLLNVKAKPLVSQPS